MTVEKINSVQPYSAAQFPEVQQTETPTARKSSGSSKDVVTVLSVLAALGAAGVAIYKHNNAKKMIEEAKAAAKKEIEEAENKAKQAAEETENKVKEAVEKVKNEYEKNEKKVDDIQQTAKNQTKKTKKEKHAPKVLEGGILDDRLNEVYKPLLKRIKRERNGLIVLPSFTNIPEYFTKVKNSLKNKIDKIKAVKKTAGKVTPKAAEDTEKTSFKDKAKTFYDNLKARFRREPKTADVSVKPETDGKTSRLRVYGEKISETSKQIKDYISKKWNEFSGLFRRKKAEPPVVEETEVPKADYGKFIDDLAKPEPAPSDIFKGIKMPDVKDISEKDLVTEYNVLEKYTKGLPVMSEESQRFLQVKGELLNHRGYKVMPDGKIAKNISKS